MSYAIWPSFIYTSATVNEFEEWRSSFKENGLRLCQSIFCRHGNDIIGMRTKFISMRATIGKFEKWRSKFKEKCLRIFVVIYKHVWLWFWCWLLNTLCIQSSVNTICELYWHMWSHYKVLPGAICCCLQKTMLFTNKYDQSLRVMDIYVLTKFHYYTLFRFWVVGVESEEEGEGEDEQNSLS